MNPILKEYNERGELEPCNPIKINASSAYGEVGVKNFRFSDKYINQMINKGEKMTLGLKEEDFIERGKWYYYGSIKIGKLDDIYCAYVHDRFIEPSVIVDVVLTKVIEFIFRFDNVSDITADETLRKIRHLVVNRNSLEFTEKL